MAFERLAQTFFRLGKRNFDLRQKPERRRQRKNPRIYGFGPLSLVHQMPRLQNRHRQRGKYLSHEGSYLEFSDLVFHSSFFLCGKTTKMVGRNFVTRVSGLSSHRSIE